MDNNRKCKLCDKSLAGKSRSIIYCCDRCKYRDSGYKEKLDYLVSAVFDDEIWVDIDGFEGFYMASNKGRIKSIDRNIISKNRVYLRKGVILKPNIYKNGYLWVVLSKNKVCAQHFVHRIIANCFVNNEFKHNVINHIDGDKTNNSAINLEWCTQKHNAHHAHKNGLCINIMGENCHMSVLTNEQAAAIRKGYKKGDNIDMIAERYGVHHMTIRRVIQNKTFKHI